jgi:hypothetical protein
MFRASCVHHQEDHLYVHAVLYGMFFMRLCKQSSRWKDVPDVEHILPPANSEKIFFKHFRPRIGLVKFLSGRGQIADKFRRNYFACGKPNFTRTAFPFIPVTS